MAETTTKPADQKTPEQVAAETLAVETKAVTTNKTGIDNLLGHILGAGKKKESVKPKEGEEGYVPEDTELNEDGTPKDKPDKKSAKKPAKKPVEVKVEPAPVLDPDKIAEAAGRGAVAALKDHEERKSKKDEKSATEQDPYPYLDDDQKADLPILAQMEKANPDKYKGIATKYAASIKTLNDYRSKWEAENKGKEWDATADEHNEFFEKNNIGWNDRDYAEAIADLKVSKAQEAWKKEQQAVTSKLEGKERARELEPLAVTEAKRNGKALFESVGGEFAKILNDDFTTNKEALAKAMADEPVKSNMVLIAASHLERLASENYRLFNGIATFDANNPIHKQLADFAVAQEADMLNLAPQDRMDKENKIFATSEDYYKMTKKEQARHWTFTATDLNTLWAAEMAVSLKNNIAAREKELEGWATKRGYKKVEGDEESAVEQTDKPAKANGNSAVVDDEKPRSVNTIADAPVAQRRTHNLTLGKKAVPSFFQL